MAIDEEELRERVAKDVAGFETGRLEMGRRMKPSQPSPKSVSELFLGDPRTRAPPEGGWPRRDGRGGNTGGMGKGAGSRGRGLSFGSFLPKRPNEQLCLLALIAFAIEFFAFGLDNNALTIVMDTGLAFVALYTVFNIGEGGGRTTTAGIIVLGFIFLLDHGIRNALPLAWWQSVLGSVGAGLLALALLRIFFGPYNIRVLLGVGFLLWLQAGGLEKLQLVLAHFTQIATADMWYLSQFIWPVWMLAGWWSKREEASESVEGTHLPSTLVAIYWVTILVGFFLISGLPGLFAYMYDDSTINTPANREAIERFRQQFDRSIGPRFNSIGAYAVCRWKATAHMLSVNTRFREESGPPEVFSMQQCLDKQMGTDEGPSYDEKLKGGFLKDAQPGPRLYFTRTERTTEADLSSTRIEGRFKVEYSDVAWPVTVRAECFIGDPSEGEWMLGTAEPEELVIGNIMTTGSKVITCSVPTDDFDTLPKGDRNNMIMRVRTLGAPWQANVDYWHYFIRADALEKKLAEFEQKHEPLTDREPIIDLFKDIIALQYPDLKPESKAGPRDTPFKLIMKTEQLPIIGVKDDTTISMQLAVEYLERDVSIWQVADGIVTLPSWLVPSENCYLLDNPLPPQNDYTLKYPIKQEELRHRNWDRKSGSQIKLPSCSLRVTESYTDFIKSDLVPVALEADIQYDVQAQDRISIREEAVDRDLVYRWCDPVDEGAEIQLELPGRLPCLSINVIEQILEGHGSPIEDMGRTIWSKSLQTHIDPRVFLAVYALSGHGTERYTAPNGRTIHPNSVMNPGGFVDTDSEPRCETLFGGKRGVVIGEEDREGEDGEGGNGEGGDGEGGNGEEGDGGSTYLCEFSSWRKGAEAWFDFMKAQTEAGQRTVNDVFSSGYPGIDSTSQIDSNDIPFMIGSINEYQTEQQGFMA